MWCRFGIPLFSQVLIKIPLLLLLSALVEVVLTAEAHLAGRITALPDSD
jgi:hypothetical protein